MPRVKRGTKRRARRKKYLKRTKGFFLTKSKLYQSAQEAANRADRYAKRDRRVKKRQYRRLWIQRVGAAARQNGLATASSFTGSRPPASPLTAKFWPTWPSRTCRGLRHSQKKPEPLRPSPQPQKPNL